MFETIFDDIAHKKLALLESLEGSPFSAVSKALGMTSVRHFKNADLSFVDFSNSDLRGYNFSGSDLRGASGCNCHFDKSTIFAGAQVSGSIFEHEVQLRELERRLPDWNAQFRQLKSTPWAGLVEWLYGLAGTQGRRRESRELRWLLVSRLIDSRADALVVDSQQVVLS